MKNNIVIIDYGSGNIRSVKFALERLGYDGQLTDDADTILNADKVIFPGVGHAKSAMEKLQSKQLDKVIPQLKQPVLGICLGMQLMCEFSEEADTKCLGIFPLPVKIFRTQLKVPHMGWNQIQNLKSPLFEHIPEDAFVYYVHSYYVENSSYTIASSHYEMDFSGALQKNNFYACQFHPEKSSNYGQQILKNFLAL